MLHNKHAHQRIDWPPVSRDRRAAPAARLVHFAEKVPPTYPTYPYWYTLQRKFLQRIHTLAPSLAWSPFKSRASGETGTLCRESSSNVSTLISVPISALIGQSDYKPNYSLHVIIYECLHVCRMNVWIVILPMLVAEYFPWFQDFPWFQGYWKAFSLQSVSPHGVASLGVEFKSFSIVIAVPWTRRV